MYVADSDNNRVCVFDVSGRYVKSVGADGSELRAPLGLALDRDGRLLFVVDSGSHCVKVRAARESAARRLCDCVVYAHAWGLQGRSAWFAS